MLPVSSVGLRDAPLRRTSRTVTNGHGGPRNPNGRRVRQRGAALVELALCLLPTMALLLGIIDFAMPIFLHSLFNHAVRAGVRYGVTCRTESGMTHSQSIRAVVQRNSGGFITSSAGRSCIQVRYYSPVTFAEVTGAEATAGGNILDVRISGYRWGWTAPFWKTGTGLDVRASSADRMETLPRGAARPLP